jgi:hypothetical protein
MPKPAFKDNELIETRALPNGAATVKGAAIEVGCGTPDDFPVNCEFLIEAPALTVGELANGDTMKYSLITGDTDDFTNNNFAVLVHDVITQTGADGAGAAAASAQTRLPIGGVRKYVGLQIVNSAAGNPSAKTATLSLLV